MSSSIIIRNLFLVVLLIPVLLVAQPAAEFQSATSLPGGGLQINTTNGAVQIKPYTAHTLEVTYEPEGYDNPPSYALVSQSVQARPEYTETAATIEYATQGWSVAIQKSPFRLRYAYRGEALLEEAPGYMTTDSTRGFRFRIDSEEKLMGGGERALGMDRRGHRLKLYNTPSYGYEEERDLMYYSMPVVISSKKYMLVFDNGATGYLDLGATAPNLLQMEAIGGRMSYLLVGAETWPELATHFTSLTGRQPMLPRWAYGNIASRMGYHSQREAEQVVQQYREDDIPLDAIVFDLFWFGKTIKGTLGNLEWCRDSFPEPENMMEDFAKQGVQTILITEPFILRNTNYYEEVLEKELVGVDASGDPYHFSFYFGEGTLLDVFNPRTREWFWSIYRKHTESGVSGWWGDLGEPEMHPDDLLHVNGRADELHNLYGHAWAGLVYDGFRRDFPERRPVILMRSGFVGSQRYGILPWTGDVSRSWGGFKPQVEIALQMGLQGLGHMHSDLGGFAGDYKDAELYTRWLQYGVFQPIYRTHAQEAVPAEPIFWDEQTKDIVRRYIKMRYALLPYQYTLAYENARYGWPMMRPLFYLEDNPDLIDNKKTYLWGDAFLVSPVTEKGAKSQSVYLPEGYTWINYWSGEPHQGGQTVNVPLSLEEIPLFVRAGAFVPMAPVVASTQQYSSEVLQVHYYDHPAIAESSGKMYEDDGQTPFAWRQEAYELLRFSAAKRDGALTIEVAPEGYDYEGRPARRAVELIVHGREAAPGQVTVNGKNIRKKDWEMTGNKLRIPVEIKDAAVRVAIR